MSDEKKPQVVFDCMIFIQAVLSDTGPAATLLDLLEADAFTLFVSAEILDEAQGVLSRPKLRASKPSLTDERIEAVLKRVTQKAILIGKVPHKFTLSRDPKDEKYINVAVEAQVDYIVSRDKDLLDLMTGHTEECKDFRRRFRLLEVIDPVEFLREIAAKK